MITDIVVDVADAEKLLATMQKQLPYALAKAVNETARNVRDTMRDEVLMRFTVRQKAFVRGQFQITHQARKTDPQIYAEITASGAGYRGGTKTRDILSIFELGGAKTAADPDFPMAIPSTNIRPTFAATPPRALLPVNLGLRPRRQISGGFTKIKRHVTSGGIVQLQGKRRTFVLDPKTMMGVKTWGVYQRTGKGPHDIRLLWTYRSKITVPARLGFVKTAEAVILARWPANFYDCFSAALATAK